MTSLLARQTVVKSSWLFMRLLFSTLLMCVLTYYSGFAQQQLQPVKGKVTDAGGHPVIGATIMTPDSSGGTTSDQSGHFFLKVKPSTKNLNISSVGFTNKVVKIDGSDLIIILDSASSGLADVVVVGYGTQKRTSLTDAVSTIRSADILTTTSTSLSQTLSGKIPGLQIRQNTGEPGDFNSSVNIRGFGQPLYVIDGIQQEDGMNDFQQLDPSDIESISIVKDASAAVYGLKSSNGVIIVTTKKGLHGKAKFTYNGVAGIAQPTDMPAMANRAQWAQMWNDAAINAGNAPIFTKDQLDQNIAAPSYDWYGETMRNASFQHQHNLSVNGGNEGISYYTSFGYTNEEGLLKTNDINYKRYNFRTNLQINLARNWKAEVGISGRYDTKNYPAFGYYNIFYGTRTALPNSPFYANDNPDYPALQSYINPITFGNSDISGYGLTTNKSLRSFASLTYSVPFLEGLRIRGLASYNNNNSQGKSLLKSYNLYTYDSSATNPYIPHIQNSPSKITNSNADMNAVTLQAQLLYSKIFANVHQVDATVVYEQNTYNSRMSTLGREYSFYTTDQINSAGLANQTTSGIEEQRANLSLVGRFNYGFKGRYLLEYAFRYEGSYRYNPDKRWGFFPVVSAGWLISNESFMKSVPAISLLKVRGSYGLVGEDAGAPFQYVQGFSTTGGRGYEFINGTWTTGAASPAIVNKNLTWFTSKTADVGIDLGLWNNKLSVTADIYQRDRSGLLAIRNIALPNTFGGTLPQENLNSDRVRGFDVSLGYRGSIGDFHYNITGNFNFARTMNRHVESSPFLSSMDKWRNGLSDRWGDLVWGYQLDGQFKSQEEINTAPIQNENFGNSRQLPGDYRYKDLNEDGVIDANDQAPLFTNGTPKMFYGLTLAASWKRFDFNALLQGAADYTLRFREVYAEVFAFGLNTPAYFYDRWHKADPYDPNSAWIAGTWPATRLINNSAANYNESSVWRRDASFVRLKSLQLGYSFNSSVLNKAGINTARIYVSAYDILTIADPFVKAFDPEKIEGLNSDGFTYPLTKTYNVGLTFTF